MTDISPITNVFQKLQFLTVKEKINKAFPNLHRDVLKETIAVEVRMLHGLINRFFEPHRHMFTFYV